MAIPQEAQDLIRQYLSEGATNDDIVGALAVSERFPELRDKVNFYMGKGHSAADFVEATLQAETYSAGDPRFGVRESRDEGAAAGMVRQAERPDMLGVDAAGIESFREKADDPLAEARRAVPSIARGAADVAGDMGLPIGGMAMGARAGSPLGPWGALGGAALGGALGYAGADTIEKSPDIASVPGVAAENARENWLEYITKGGMDTLLGAGIGKGLSWAGAGGKAAAKALYHRALRPSAMKNVSEVNQLLEKGLEQGQVATAGQVEKNLAEMTDLGKTIDALVADAGRKGVRIPTRPVRTVLRNRAKEIEDVNNATAGMFKTEAASTRDLANKWGRPQPNEFGNLSRTRSPQMAQKAKKQLDEGLRNAWNREGDASRPATPQSLGDEKAVSNELRRLLGNKVGKPYKAANDRWHDLIELNGLLNNATNRSGAGPSPGLPFLLSTLGTVAGGPASGLASGAAAAGAGTTMLPGVQTHAATKLWPLAKILEAAGRSGALRYGAGPTLRDLMGEDPE
jgi:hypothetical protein